MKSQEARDRIIAAAIELLHEHQNIEQISMRKIAVKAGVGVGLMNYHFQSKENLIRTAVRVFVGSVIARWDTVVPRDSGSDAQAHLTLMLQATADFLISYPTLSRISILSDLTAPAEDDNTMQTVAGMMPMLEQINSQASRADLELAAAGFMSRLQWFFLRQDQIAARTGFVFSDKEQRDVFVQNLVQQLVNEVKQAD